MLIFTLRRLNLFIFTMFLLTLLSFSLSFLFPGEQLINISGQINATPKQLIVLAEQYQTNNNIAQQYFSYISHLFQGDLGISMASQLSISNEIMRFLPATIELSLVALFIAMVFGIPIGFIAAIKHRKATDNIILTISMLGYSIPVFWLGLLAILIFSIQLGWLPSAGQLSLVFEIEHVTGIQFIDILLSDSPYKWQAFQDASAHIFLPACVIALAPATIFVRLARTAMMDVLDSQYIRAAKAKGLSFKQIIYHHAIRNAMVHVIRDVGLQFANLVTIAMVTEVIFSWPGIGRWLIESIFQRDHTSIQGGLLALSSFIFIVHIVIDFIYAALNPLARESRNGA
ncbi:MULTISPECIES: ABC transporter permease [unclassified Colwellia]|jgi:cationic peptide transport system permease protein|uniref:ABC transporter permease n=1 Tax=unclassified Colwellia TaxID=196834 RepID=UPI0015F72E4D|nr:MULTISPECIES: ABC transporter permease [unclassified Colwellia]MBA6363279.1 ABC transporter permease [Colwellia sp. BRX8-8]MBA6338145.1 ABC transporter permease [Colwellia sp. BRX8-7]MBA6347218.1 ABC transporter permease [Colwellia sp. BRX8-9]MBA6351115.1 ABC transporter permease [Colwellia sp. BRX9-1]MBA6355549.1 ABC transporter permease [Colwellia sp. BRX8-3]